MACFVWFWYRFRDEFRIVFGSTLELLLVKRSPTYLQELLRKLASKKAASEDRFPEALACGQEGFLPLRVIEPPQHPARSTLTTRLHLFRRRSQVFPYPHFPSLPLATFCAQDGPKAPRVLQTSTLWGATLALFSVFLLFEICALQIIDSFTHFCHYNSSTFLSKLLPKISETYENEQSIFYTKKHNEWTKIRPKGATRVPRAPASFFASTHRGPPNKDPQGTPKAPKVRAKLGCQIALWFESRA